MNQPSDEQVIAGKVASQAIMLGREMCKKEIQGTILDREIEMFIRDNDCLPALRGYKPPFDDKTYPFTICLSINNEAVHGTPIKIVNPQDLITIDLVVEYRGWFADTARTFTYVDPATPEGLEVATFAAISEGIFKGAQAAIRPNQSLSLFGITVELSAQASKYSPVKEYCGHGIGQGIHMDPQVCNYNDHSEHIFEIGHSYAVEPVLAHKTSYQLQHETDGWTVSTNCLSTHNEDTVFISNKGVVNLTSNDERE